jgi:hypothetical protein
LYKSLGAENTPLGSCTVNQVKDVKVVNLESLDGKNEALTLYRKGEDSMAIKEWHEDNHVLKGYKWSVQAEYDTVTISEEDLFNRVEFEHLQEHEYKVAYAVDLGWRYNIDSSEWYRIRGH